MYDHCMTCASHSRDCAITDRLQLLVEEPLLSHGDTCQHLAKHTEQSLCGVMLTVNTERTECNRKHSRNKTSCVETLYLHPYRLSALQCASTWLSGMVDPTVIADGLVDLQPIVTSTHNQIATINTDLTGYAVRLHLLQSTKLADFDAAMHTHSTLQRNAAQLHQSVLCFAAKNRAGNRASVLLKGLLCFRLQFRA